MEILDTDLLPRQPSQAKSVLFLKAKLYSFLIVSSIAFNVFSGYQVTANSSDVSKVIALLSSVIIIFIFNPLASALLAIVFAILPYKKKTYRQKYVPMALFIYLILSVLISLLFIAGWYVTNGTLKF